MEQLTRRGLRRVPEITALFWVTKILTTAMGESFSDFLVFKINPYIAVMLGAIGLVIALALQFSAKRYVPWIYWFTVAMVAVFGTMAADVLHIQFGVPYLLSSTFFVVCLVIVFWAWRRSEKTLSIHSIYTPRREMFYWATVMATFALGTAAGDLTAITGGLGYLSSGLLFAALIVIPALAYWLFGLDEIATFWLAYILTRPLGASFADWAGKAHAAGGLGLGDASVSLALTVLIVGCAVYMTRNHKEIKRERSVHSM